MINRKNTYKSKSNNETDDKKAKSALQHCSRNNGVRTPGPAVLTALRKPAAFALLICIVAAIFRGFGDSKSPLIFVAVACVVNIIGDLILVAGFHLDAAGAAIATVAAQAVSVILAFIILKKKEVRLPHPETGLQNQ